MTLAPFFAIVNATFSACVVLSLIVPSPYVFSTLSNVTFLAVAALLAFSRRIGENVGVVFQNVLTSTGALLFLGCSSLAYHSESIQDSKQHFVDILGGWVLVVHVAVTSTLALLTAVLYSRLSEANKPRLLIMTTTLNIGCTTVFIVCAMRYYEQIKNQQLVIFLTAGPLAAASSTFARFLLAYRDGGLSRNGVMIALFEALTLLVLLFGGVVCQGELLFRQLDRFGKEYDLFHGCWHFALATCTGALYRRNGQVVQDAVKNTSKRCVCTLSASDAVVLLLLFSFGVTMTVVKETSGSPEPALVVLAILLSLHGLYEAGRSFAGVGEFQILPFDDKPLSQP